VSDPFARYSALKSKVVKHNVLVRPDRPRYAEMVERARLEPGEALPDSAGLWIPECWWHEGRR
jgi:hypothetical protein